MDALDLTVTRLTQRAILAISLVSVVALHGLGCSQQPPPTNEQSVYPRRPIKILVPFEAGGGSDTFARTMAQAVESHQLLPHRLIIVNLPGASGTLGSRRLLNSEADGYTILLLHEAILTAKYSGKVAYGPEAFLPIAATGSSPLVICVASNSEFDSLPSLMKQASATPDRVVFAANIGAPSQFAGLLLERETTGAKFRYTQIGGGTKRFAALKGDHAAVSAFSLAEYVQFKESGLRALAVCSPERHPDVPEIPTSIEQGFDCVSENMQFWWAPRNTPHFKIERIAEVLRKALEKPAVRDRLAQMRITPTFLNASQLLEEIRQRETRLQSVSLPASIPLPNIPLIVGVSIALCILILVIRAIGTRETNTTRYDTMISQYRSIVPSCGLLILYAVLLQTTSLGFVSCTSGFLISLSLLLAVAESNSTAVSGALTRRYVVGFSIFSVAFSVLLNIVFTRILVIDLP